MNSLSWPEICKCDVHSPTGPSGCRRCAGTCSEQVLFPATSSSYSRMVNLHCLLRICSLPEVSNGASRSSASKNLLAYMALDLVAMDSKGGAFPPKSDHLTGRTGGGRRHAVPMAGRPYSTSFRGQRAALARRALADDAVKALSPRRARWASSAVSTRSWRHPCRSATRFPTAPR